MTFEQIITAIEENRVRFAGLPEQWEKWNLNQQIKFYETNYSVVGNNIERIKDHALFIFNKRDAIPVVLEYVDLLMQRDDD